MGQLKPHGDMAMILLGDYDIAKKVRRAIKVLIAHDVKYGNTPDLDELMTDLGDLFDELNITDEQRDLIDLTLKREKA